jgi:serine/threonine kinase 16
MHAASPAPLAHRDVKPHNILLRRRRAGSAGAPAASAAAASQDAAHLVSGGGPLSFSSPGGAPGSSSAADGASPQQALPSFDRCDVAVMDFGSAAAARVCVTSRAQAVALQEDAEVGVRRGAAIWKRTVVCRAGRGTNSRAAVANPRSCRAARPPPRRPQRLCSAPYRAPELWDVPSSCQVDERVDVWAAGAVLYFLLVGESPFERAANEAGGSLMLAVVKCETCLHARAGVQPCAHPPT